MINDTIASVESSLSDNCVALRYRWELIHSLLLHNSSLTLTIMSPSDSSNQSEQVSTLPLPLLCPSPHDDRALVSSLFKTKPDTNDGQYPNYPTDEALILSNPDLLFSLDAEPET